MIKLDNIGISIDTGTIAPIYKLPFSLGNIGVSIDAGLIPPKNYFQPKYDNMGVSLDKAEAAILFYQVN